MRAGARDSGPAAGRPSGQEKALWLSGHALGTHGLQEGDTRGALAFLGRAGGGSTSWFREKKKWETSSPLSSLWARLLGIWLFPFWEGGSNEVSSSSHGKSSTTNMAATAHLRPRAGRAAPRQRPGRPRTHPGAGGHTSPPELLLIKSRK